MVAPSKLRSVPLKTGVIAVDFFDNPVIDTLTVTGVMLERRFSLWKMET
jgi:hypothetical protein